MTENFVIQKKDSTASFLSPFKVSLKLGQVPQELANLRRWEGDSHQSFKVTLTHFYFEGYDQDLLQFENVHNYYQNQTRYLAYDLNLFLAKFFNKYSTTFNLDKSEIDILQEYVTKLPQLSESLRDLKCSSSYQTIDIFESRLDSFYLKLVGLCPTLNPDLAQSSDLYSLKKTLTNCSVALEYVDTCARAHEVIARALKRNPQLKAKLLCVIRNQSYEMYKEKYKRFGITLSDREKEMVAFKDSVWKKYSGVVFISLPLSTKSLLPVVPSLTEKQKEKFEIIKDYQIVSRQSIIKDATAIKTVVWVQGKYHSGFFLNMTGSKLTEDYSKAYLFENFEQAKARVDELDVAGEMRVRYFDLKMQLGLSEQVDDRRQLPVEENSHSYSQVLASVEKLRLTQTLQNINNSSSSNLFRDLDQPSLDSGVDKIQQQNKFKSKI